MFREIMPSSESGKYNRQAAKTPRKGALHREHGEDTEDHGEERKR
jgi:hypothetical protein